MNKEINLKNIKITDPFWAQKQDLVADIVIPYQEKILNDEIEGAEKSHALANFRIAAGLEAGEFYGMVFQDSDVAKWIEAAAYALAAGPNPELEKTVDDVIALYGASQHENGWWAMSFTLPGSFLQEIYV